jgi:hypothetical protein
MLMLKRAARRRNNEREVDWNRDIRMPPGNFKVKRRCLVSADVSRNLPPGYAVLSAGFDPVGNYANFLR